jgi:hypothetical protein
MTYLRQASLDFAAALRADTLNNNVAVALLALEDQGHDAGWDHPVNAPTLFYLNAHPTTSRVRLAWAQPLTQAFQHVMTGAPPHRTGAVLLHVARLVHKGIASGDLILDVPPWPLHGYGIRMEMAVDIDEIHGDEATCCSGGFEARAIVFVDVSGHAWWIVRIRDQEVEVGAGPRTDEASFSFAHALDGLIAAALQRPFPER